MLFNDKDVAVLDLTHGGIPLVQHLANYSRSVTAMDVYGTVDKEILTHLEKDGIYITKNINSHEFDLIVAPVHMDPAFMPDPCYCPVITHHMAVGELLLNSMDGSKIIEITGTGAKTSSAVLLADMASRNMSVVSHTSHGVEQWSNGVAKMIYNGLSIAPGSILKAIDLTSKFDPDLYIFEVSLGCTGAADIEIITTLENEYAIANGTLTSTAAKSKITEYIKKDATLLINASSNMINPPGNVRTVTFSDTVKGSDVYLEQSGTGQWSVSYHDMADTIRFVPDTGYDPATYSTAMACASCAGVILDINPDTIKFTLEHFKGVHGRMQLIELDGCRVLDNSNSGMNIRSATQALEYSKRIAQSGSRLVLILGEEAQQVCEGLEPEDVSTFLNNHAGEVNDIFLVGERMQGIDGDNLHYFSGLSSAIKEAKVLTRKNDIIISCVKCFR
jgi:UDP-N-acetylmuramyl pentapeptide synthase